MLLNNVLFAFLAMAPYASTYLEEEMHRTCEKSNVASDNYQRAQVYLEGYNNCSARLPTPMGLPKLNELEAARQNGNLDQVTRKFCANEEIKFCMAQLHWASGLCLKYDEQKDIPYSAVIYSRIIDYLCKEEGNKTIIAKFVDEDAVQCYNKFKQFELCTATNQPEDKDLRTTYEKRSMCVVEQLKEYSDALGARAQNMSEYILNISTADLKANHENMTRWVEEQLKSHRTQNMLESFPNGACKLAIISELYVAVIVLASILSALPAILCNIQQHF